MCPWHPITQVTPSGCVHGTPSHRPPHPDVSMAPHHTGHPIQMCPWHPITQVTPWGRVHGTLSHRSPHREPVHGTPSHRSPHREHVHGTPSHRSSHQDVSMAHHHRGHPMGMCPWHPITQVTPSGCVHGT